MIQQDDIKITILDDGRIKIETDQISQANHTSAEKLLQELSRLTDGSLDRTRRGKGLVHHQHQQKHSH